VNIASDTSGDFYLDKSLYSLTSIQSTIYKFAADFFIEINDSDKTYLISFKLKSESKYASDEVSEFKNIFVEKLLDEVLRERIRAETADIRQLIIATTFSSLVDKSNDGHS
jgi:His-Xaa-Ser system protein HxsD|tara:strand:+ start:749 stop:1081 length:333 start_codon:yes stop_codon:yes gene_type:complete